MTGPFTVRKHDEGDGLVRLAVHGDVDSDTSAALSLIVVNAIEQPGVETLLIDLDGVTFLAAAGVRSLLEGRAAALLRECGYQVVNAHGIVGETLAASGLTGSAASVLRWAPHPSASRSLFPAPR